MELRTLYQKREMISELYAHEGGSHCEDLFRQVFLRKRRANPTLCAYIKVLTLNLPKSRRLKFELNAAKLLA